MAAVFAAGAVACDGVIFIVVVVVAAAAAAAAVVVVVRCCGRCCRCSRRVGIALQAFASIRNPVPQIDALRSTSLATLTPLAKSMQACEIVTE